jgi:hypothetical protein
MNLVPPSSCFYSAAARTTAVLSNSMLMKERWEREREGEREKKRKKGKKRKKEDTM